MLSMMFVVVALLLILLLCCIQDCSKPLKFPPGPSWLPIIGCLPIFNRLRKKYGYVHLAFEKLSEIYGPIIGVKLGNKKFVVVSSYELAKKVLLGEEFNARPDGFFFRVRSFGARKGILFTEGATWSRNRCLTMRHLRALGFGQSPMENNLMAEARHLVDILGEKAGQNGQHPIAMHKVFDVAVLNALWMMLAGHRFSYDDSRLEEILEIVHDAFKITDTLGGVVSQIPFLRHVFPELSGYNRLMLILEKLWTFIGEEVDDHEKKIHADNHEPRDLIDGYVREMMNSAENPDGRTFDRQDTIVLCLDLFLAGSKTTTDALAITFAFLAHNPKWLKILQEDMDKVVPADRYPSLQDAPLMPRIEAFLAETQRTLILTPLGVPHNTTKNVHLGGYVIPKDTTVLVNFHGAHNDEVAWDKPHEFMPERFLDQNGRFNRNHNFMQFGLGKRRCLGESLARSSLFLFFTHIIQRFNIEISKKHGPPCLDGNDGFVISPKPYYLTLIPRFSRE